MKRHFVAIALTLLCGALTACDGGSSLTAVSDTAAISPAPATGRLQAGDKLKVTVFGEDKLSGDYEIDPAGFVSLPLAGTIQAAGLSKTELEQSLAKKFRSEYLRNPKVTVDVSTFRPFYVLGEVEKPGEYPFKSGLNVLSAIAVAGGNTYRSSTSKVMIQRAGQNGFQEVAMSPSIPVYPGDLIRVPARYF